jgi:hypothetical protein
LIERQDNQKCHQDLGALQEDPQLLQQVAQVVNVGLARSLHLLTTDATA